MTFKGISRQVDKWVSKKGEIWEIKHQLGKVPSDQAADYYKMVKKTDMKGNLVKQVHYVFPTEDAAKLNKHLAETYRFSVHYIDEATGEMKLLY